MNSKIFIAALFATIAHADVRVVENTTSHNAITSCSPRPDHQVVCITYNLAALFEDVKTIHMCPYSYCLTFLRDDTRVVCGGFEWTTYGGGKEHVYSPLSPPGFDTVTDYHAPLALDMRFMGYSMWASDFVPARETLGVPNLTLSCAEPYSTCFGPGDTMCAGFLDDVYFMSTFASFMLPLLHVLFASTVFFVALRSCTHDALARFTAVTSVVTVTIAFPYVVINLVVDIMGYYVGACAGALLVYVLTPRCFPEKIDIKPREKDDDELSYEDANSFDINGHRTVDIELATRIVSV